MYILCPVLTSLHFTNLLNLPHVSVGFRNIINILNAQDKVGGIEMRADITVQTLKRNTIPRDILRKYYIELNIVCEFVFRNMKFIL